MPELPEVETIKNIVKKILVGRRITNIDVLRDSTILGSKKEFIECLKGEIFTDVTRIGKFLIFHLTNQKVFISHLRMEGKYFEVLENEPNTDYSRVVFHLDNSHKICYDDSRCFGIMKVSTEDEYKNTVEISKLGPEPFDISDSDYLFDKNRTNKQPIKSTLLDQTLMAGIGNIYADEILIAAKINPLTPAYVLNKAEWNEILINSKRILKEAIEAGGSTIKSYHPGKGINGEFQTRLLAYGRKGKECALCGTPMEFIKVGGRGTTFCPKCQILKKDTFVVAIYGKIAAGKSTVLEMLSDKGYPIISCDAIVSSLYQKAEVIDLINKAFGLNEIYIDKNILRSIASDCSQRIKLESIIHPLVRKEIIKFIKNKKGLIFVEIPLLYEANMEDLFDSVIAIDIDEEIQNKRLVTRNPDSASQLKSLNNKNSVFDINKKKAEFIINNDSDLNILTKQVDKTINKLKVHLN